MKKFSIVLSAACFMLVAFSLVNQASAGCHRKACCVPCCTPCCDKTIEVTVYKPVWTEKDVKCCYYVPDCDNCCCCVKGKHCRRVVCCCPMKKVECTKKVNVCTWKAEKQLMKLTPVCVATGCFKKHCRIVYRYTPVCCSEAAAKAEVKAPAKAPVKK